MSTDDSPGGPNLDYRPHVTLDEIPQEGQKLLLEYSGLTYEELLPHILDIRDRAFKISPYPCVGQVRFLGNRWPSMPYLEQSFLPRLRDGATLLDVGCGFGQDIRFLTFEYGVDSSQLFATDIATGLMDLGYDLFRDRDRIEATFFTADLLDPGNSLTFNRLKGTFDLIQASQFFHCWDWDDQVTVAKNVATLSYGPGSQISGTQVGSKNAGTYAILKSCAVSGAHYRHSEESWKRFWKQVGDETDTEWDVEYHEIYSQAVEASRTAWWAKNDPGMTMFWYSATRI
ncbi:MAG: hypothetical protein M1831_004467 [Alyxoria varia]|nr:MAG: hypothetical protein M1831_004467 [Alyxoria varia]